MIGGWPFVLAAYAVCVAATLVLTAVSYIAMRRAEAKADALTRR